MLHKYFELESEEVLKHSIFVRLCETVAIILYNNFGLNRRLILLKITRFSHLLKSKGNSNRLNFS